MTTETHAAGQPVAAPPAAGRKERIVILGGGFAGVYTAMFLERGMTRAERARIELTIVSNENYIVFQPLLPEVISGTIDTLHCLTPIRRLARRTQLYTRNIEAIDVARKVVRLGPGYRPKPLELPYDQLVVCLGTRLNFDLVPGTREHAIPFKNLGDALRLRNEAVRVLEEANIETDPEEKRRLLTFVVGGGGFSGVECIAELHDFVCSAELAYDNISRADIHCVLLQSGARILPEVSEDLAAYAHRILSDRGIEIRLNTRLQAVSADAAIIQDKATGTRETIPSRTIVTTVPAAPHPLIDALPTEHEGGRIRVSEHLDVPGLPGLWALGDCAAVPQVDGIFSPPTAQHALRQARTCADNILASLRGKPLQKFTFTGLGSLASLGHYSAVADVLGVRLRGFIAWVFWRAIYLVRFPGFDRQVRIAIDWLLDILLPRDITQLRIFAPEQIHNERFHTGERVFDRGDYGNKLYVVMSGEAEVRRDGELLARLGPGEMFGEAALLSDAPRNAEIRAASALEVLSVSRPAFEKLVRHLPGTRHAIMEVMRGRGLDASLLGNGQLDNGRRDDSG
jgi:NADH dehydrogenase